MDLEERGLICLRFLCLFLRCLMRSLLYWSGDDSELLDVEVEETSLRSALIILRFFDVFVTVVLLANLICLELDAIRGPASVLLSLSLAWLCTTRLVLRLFLLPLCSVDGWGWDFFSPMSPLESDSVESGWDGQDNADEEFSSCTALGWKASRT